MTTLESTRPEDATIPADLAALLPSYAQLRPYVRFYPLGRDRKPLVARFQSAITTDPDILSRWMRMRRFAGFGAHIDSSQLLVLDLENPIKSGHCGYTALITLLEDAGIKLPPGPSVRTANGGWHVYFRIPDNTLAIRKHIALWPGIDILTLGSNVIQPGTVLGTGSYSVVSAFREGLPDCPAHLLQLIAARQAQTTFRRAAVLSVPPPEPLPPGLTNREWFRLRCNPTFRRMWDRAPKRFDDSASAYEYHIAKAVLAQGLSFSQAEGVIAAWRNKHNLWVQPGKGGARPARQIRAIVEGAWREVAEWVKNWQLQQERKKAEKSSNSSRGRILALLSGSGPHRITEVARRCDLSYDQARKALGRLEHDGAVTRHDGLYAAADYTIYRTNLGITTPHPPVCPDSSEGEAAAQTAVQSSSPVSGGHGRPRSATAEMAEGYLLQDPEISNARLAELVGVTPKYAAVLRYRIKNRPKPSDNEPN